MKIKRQPRAKSLSHILHPHLTVSQGARYMEQEEIQE